MAKRKTAVVPVVSEKEEVVTAPEALLVQDEGAVAEVNPSPEQLEQSVRRYFAMRDTLDRLLDKQMVEIHGTKYRCKGFWLAIASGFKLDLECIKEERYETGDDFGWIVTFRVTDRDTGRFVDGDGTCALSEKHGSMRTEHNVRAHANTRARIRAIAGMCAFGEVGAEEIVDGEAPSTIPTSAKFVKANSDSTPKKPTGFDAQLSALKVALGQVDDDGGEAVDRFLAECGKPFKLSLLADPQYAELVEQLTLLKENGGTDES